MKGPGFCRKKAQKAHKKTAEFKLGAIRFCAFLSILAAK